MDFCWSCGEPIEFRWIDGGPKPIHESGWCRGYRADGPAGTTQPDRPIRAARESASKGWSVGHARCDLGEPLTHPTTCPVCGAEIFFHTNGNGDCVFFDALGKPWPKHPCLSHESGRRRASQSAQLMSLVDMVVRPPRIGLPSGIVIEECAEDLVGQLVMGIVLGVKPKRVWRAQSGTAVRSPIQVSSILLQVGLRRVVRIYAPPEIRFEIGRLVQMVTREEDLDGRRALYCDAGSIVTPEDEATSDKSDAS